MTDQQTTVAPLLDEEELVAIVTELLDALVESAGLDPHDLGGLAAPTPLHGTAMINGDPSGRLVIDTDAGTATALAQCWGLVGPEGPTSADAVDALGEFVNLVGGTVKTAFEEESFVGIPEVTEGEGPEPFSQPVEVFHPVGRFVVQFGLA